MGYLRRQADRVMNTIRRRRRRPRVDSVNFRTVWWVLQHEAALRILHPTAVGSTWEPHAREYLSHIDSRHLRRAVASVLRVRNERRWWPM